MTMTAINVVKDAYKLPDFVCRGYLSDLSDEELLVRPVAGANHIAWQLGHLIASERKFLESIRQGSMPALPSGFADRHSSQTASSDRADDFLTKADYFRLYDSIRGGTLAV